MSLPQESDYKQEPSLELMSYKDKAF